MGLLQACMAQDTSADTNECSHECCHSDKGAIVLHFVPMDAPKEKTILVKLEEQSTGGEEEEEVLLTAYNKWHPAHGQDQRHVVLTLSRSAAAPRQLAPKFVDGVASDGSRRRMVRDPLENPRYLTHRSY